ncbi:MAG: BlaI/MecI/CopY family transcriptional regulator [Fusicatenibacter sp.]|nr:BlaI/MecI/CopY family transcriptional regulator [Lachnospiraceae bacterium]MDY2936900.1 BlaI/MecI/CopY family transcriptional regulator [Fusicatenibacter sp.]
MKLSEREWTVLNALWEADGAELGTIVNILFPHTGWSRNTVLTYLTRMEAKGLVRIDKDTSPHSYHATLDRESCQQQERQSFLKRVYSGSAGDLVAAFLKEEPISAEERERLRKILDEMEV